MRLLMLSPNMPFPPNTGGLVRIYYILKGLSCCFDIDFMAPVDSDVASNNFYPSIGAMLIPIRVSQSYLSIIQKGLRFVLTATPLHTCWYAYSEMRKAVSIQMNLNKYDAIYCHLAHSLEYLPSSMTTPVILDTQNDDQQYWERKVASTSTLSWRRLLWAWNLRKVKHYEQSYISRLWAHVAVSEPDRQLVMKRSRSLVPHYFVARNGVDINKYVPIDWKQRSVTAPVTLAFLGSLDLEINVNAAMLLCKEIFPRIRMMLPNREMKLLIIGRNPPRILSDYARKTSDIIVTGTVPDVRPWLEQADVFVAPLRQGAGTKLRILEAMACALPVVGTEMALQGLDGQVGVHFLQADDEDLIVQCVCDLIKDFRRRVEIGENARRLIESQYDWFIITQYLAETIASNL